MNFLDVWNIAKDWFGAGLAIGFALGLGLCLFVLQSIERRDPRKRHLYRREGSSHD
jgi:hypothetical protein